jgi:hypothetical protein
MRAADNIAATKRGYAAFAAGDAAAAMTNLVDDIVWITPGSSAVSGTTHGKQELGANWAKLAEKEFSTVPQHIFSDGDRVVVLSQGRVGGEITDSADVSPSTRMAR